MSTYDNYARIGNGGVVVRYSVHDLWGTRAWPPRLAREFALHIIDLADQAERSSPKVVELTRVLEAGPGEESMEDLALRLVKAGYRKKS